MKNWKNKSCLFLISLMLILMCGIGGTFAYLFDVTPALLNTFKYDHTGDLVINKSVDHLLGDNYVIPDGIEFMFDVDLGTDYAGKTVIVDGETVVVDENGKIEVVVKKESSVTISEILVDTKVMVTEKNLKNGFSVQGEASQEIVISGTDKHELFYVNEYRPESVSPINVKVNGRKELTRPWIEGDAFSFQLDYKKNNVWEKISEKSIQWNDDHFFSFTDALINFTFDHVGTYSFRVSEIKGDISGIEYSDQIVYIDVIVTDMDMNGELEITSVHKNGQSISLENDMYLVDMTFVNEYQAVGSDVVTIEIDKVLTDKSGQNKEPSGFKFVLEGNGHSYESNVTGSTGEASIVVSYGPEEVGSTYTYILKEVNENKEGYIYDSKAIPLNVSIIDNFDGSVSAYIYDDNGSVDDMKDVYKATFTNIYDPMDADSVSIEGTKVLEGRELNVNEFTFNLYEADKDYQLTGNIIDTVTNNEEGKFVLETGMFNQVGTYYYVIKESVDGLGGIEYSSAQYCINVKVDDIDGVLVAEWDVENEEEIIFTNKYSVANKEHMISGNKILEEYELKADMFTFEMYDADENYEKNELIRVSQNESDGSFSFDGIEYSKLDIGKHYYVVKEKQIVNSNENIIERITFDTREYGVCVNVEDDLKGNLKITQEIIELSTYEYVNSITFVNTYTPMAQPIEVDINIEKVINVLGTESYEPEGFNFELTNQTGKKLIASSNEHGQAVITVEFTEDDLGENNYVLTEKSGNVPHMTYSDQEYQIDINVSLNSSNELEVKLFVDEEEVKQISCTFINDYNYTPNVVDTGDSQFISPLIALMVISGLLIILIKKREQLIQRSK